MSRRSPMPDDLPCPSQPIETAIRHQLEDQISRLLSLEPAARTLEPEGVHQMRSASRRLRGTIRILGPLLERLWACSLSDEVRWLAQLLGNVRDLDVLLEHLCDMRRKSSSAIPHELVRRIEDQRRDARKALLDAFESKRYELVRAKLLDAMHHPWVNTEPETAAGPVLRRRLFASARRFRKRVRGLRTDSGEEQFHTVRKRAKDLRFGALAIGPWLSREDARVARHLARRLARISDLLGKLQDAAVAPRIVSQLLGQKGNLTDEEVQQVQDWLANRARRRGVIIKRFLNRQKAAIRLRDYKGLA